MLSRLLLIAALLSWPVQALAIPILQVSDLGDGSFDVEVLTAPGVAWTTAGLTGQTHAGASFSYATDPTSGENLLTQDVPNGTGRTDVTFVHLPAEQFATKRFDRRRVPTIAGRVVGIGPPIATPGEVDVAWFDPPGGPLNAGIGFIARVVLDLSGTGLSGSSVVAGADVPPDQIGQLLASGLVVGTDDQFLTGDLAYISWSVYVPIPEPGTVVLLLVGFVCLQRRKEDLRCDT